MVFGTATSHSAGWPFGAATFWPTTSPPITSRLFAASSIQTQAAPARASKDGPSLRLIAPEPLD
jgi:hypothetical protein